MWRIPLLKYLLSIRSNKNVLDGLKYDEISEIIDNMCKNQLMFLLFSTINSLFICYIYLNPHWFLTEPL